MPKDLSGHQKIIKINNVGLLMLHTSFLDKITPYNKFWDGMFWAERDENKKIMRDISKKLPEFQQNRFNSNNPFIEPGIFYWTLPFILKLHSTFTSANPLVYVAPGASIWGAGGIDLLAIRLFVRGLKKLRDRDLSGLFDMAKSFPLFTASTATLMVRLMPSFSLAMRQLAPFVHLTLPLWVGPAGGFAYAAYMWIDFAKSLPELFTAWRATQTPYLFSERISQCKKLNSKIKTLRKSYHSSLEFGNDDKHFATLSDNNENLDKVMEQIIRKRTNNPKFGTEQLEKLQKLKTLLGEHEILKEEARTLYRVSNLAEKKKFKNIIEKAGIKFDKSFNKEATKKDRALADLLKAKQREMFVRKAGNFIALGLAATGMTLLACSTIPHASPVLLPLGLTFSAMAFAIKVLPAAHELFIKKAAVMIERKKVRDKLFASYKEKEDFPTLLKGWSWDNRIRYRLAFEVNLSRLKTAFSDVDENKLEKRYYLALRDSDPAIRKRILDAAEMEKINQVIDRMFFGGKDISQFKSADLNSNSNNNSSSIKISKENRNFFLYRKDPLLLKFFSSVSKTVTKKIAKEITKEIKDDVVDPIKERLSSLSTTLGKMKTTRLKPWPSLFCPILTKVIYTRSKKNQADSQKVRVRE